uniref:uncharacterized protein LOC120336295 isoform X4 n=1 Tax=Styela clava TaxID=7725 RepID=UPI00193AAFA5|nr:uncharacterized protein LOC120336295 isoform X4 [Styela clava]
MSKGQKPRCIVKAGQCLLPKQENQELLARNHLRYLRKIFTRKSQLVMYLGLVDMHILDKSVPPGLRIDVKPPGYKNVINERDMGEWFTTLQQCSASLLTLLRKMYIKDIEKCESIIKYSVTQLTTIITSLRGVERKVVRNDVLGLLDKISQECNKDLVSKFDVAEERIIFDKAMREDRNKILETFLNHDRKVSFADRNNNLEELEESRTKSVKLQSTCDMDVENNAHEGEHERRWVEEQTDLMQRLTLDESKRTYDNIYPSQARSDTFAKNETKNRIQAEEEEMKYLEFINGVTNDILTRGIYSDRVLTQVMQRHLDQNCSRLNESRMRHMLMKLQEDLGVSADISSRGFRSTSAYSSGYEGSSYNRSPSPESKANQGSLRSASWKSDASSRSGRLSFSETKQSSKPPVSASSGSPSIRSSVKRQKGILKTPGTSSGSDLEAKSTAFSSGDEDDKRVKKKVSVERLPSTSLEENPDKPKENHNKSIHSDIETNEASRPVPAKRSSIVSTSGSHIAESVDAEKNKKIVTEDNAVTNEKGSVENITAVTRQEDGLGLADSDLDDF